ncbi:UvrB/UvrC motif-containing protein [Methyloversatilis sp.]|uniref:UvrB/UvrC motif-containing protein n=1 Tax=Methyloversatilis sp. TaxID=2569862 RepID=UPI0035B01D93
MAEPELEYQRLSQAQQEARIKELEQTMHRHARDLEFEDAARVRDQIRRLREAAM